MLSKKNQLVNTYCKNAKAPVIFVKEYCLYRMRQSLRKWNYDWNNKPSAFGDHPVEHLPFKEKKRE